MAPRYESYFIYVDIAKQILFFVTRWLAVSLNPRSFDIASDCMRSLQIRMSYSLIINKCLHTRHTTIWNARKPKCIICTLVFLAFRHPFRIVQCPSTRVK